MQFDFRQMTIIVRVFAVTVLMGCPDSFAAEGAQLRADVLDVVNLNVKNFDALTTLHGTVEIVETRTLETGHVRTVSMEIEIWSDADHLRADTLSSEFVGEQTDTIVVKQIDDARYLLAPPAVGDIDIRSVESWFRYGGEVAFIRPPRDDESGRRQLNAILNYQTLLGRSLKEIVLRGVEKGCVFELKREELVGEECLRLDWNYGDFPESFRVWIVPAKGYCIKKMQHFWKDFVTEEYEVENFKEYPGGIWWFDKARSQKRNFKTKILYADSSVHVKAAQFNEPLNSKVFTIAGTNIPAGTVIDDKIAGIEYRYGQAKEYGVRGDLALEALAAAMQTSGPAPKPKPEASVSSPKAEEMRSEAEKRHSRGLLEYGIWVSGIALCAFFGVFIIFKRRGLQK